MSLPEAGKYVNAEKDQIFIDSIKQVIADLGRDIQLHKKPIFSDCPNCLWNSNEEKSANIYVPTNPNAVNGPLHKPFKNGGQCPVCKGVGRLNSPQSETIKVAVIKEVETLRELEKQNGYLLNSTCLIYAESEHANRLFNTEKATIDGFTWQRISEPSVLGLVQQAFVKCIFRLLS